MRPVSPAHQHHQLDQLVPHKPSEGGELGHKEVHEELSDLEPIRSGNGHPLESDDILRYQIKVPQSLQKFYYWEFGTFSFYIGPFVEFT